MANGLVGQRERPAVSPDAVVVGPGIMGSSLESESGVVWGLHRLGWYVKAWTQRQSVLDELMLTKEEWEGRYGRIRGTALLQRPAWAPFLQGIEPYGALLAGIRDVVVHEEVTVTISGVGGPTDATVVVRDEDGLVVDHPTVGYRDGSYRARFGPLSEGIYQVEVEGSGESAVSQRVLVTDA